MKPAITLSFFFVKSHCIISTFQHRCKQGRGPICKISYKAIRGIKSTMIHERISTTTILLPRIKILTLTYCATYSYQNELWLASQLSSWAKRVTK